MKTSFNLFLFIVTILTSCSNPSDPIEEKLFKYSEINHCRETQCILQLKDITWFEWDTLKFSDGEVGFQCSFYKNGKITYVYTKPSTLDFEGVQFGFGDQTLKSVYAADEAIFRLEHVIKNNKKSSFVLLPYP